MSRGEKRMFRKKGKREMDESHPVWRGEAFLAIMSWGSLWRGEGDEGWAEGMRLLMALLSPDSPSPVYDLSSSSSSCFIYGFLLRTLSFSFPLYGHTPCR